MISIYRIRMFWLLVHYQISWYTLPPWLPQIVYLAIHLALLYHITCSKRFLQRKCKETASSPKVAICFFFISLLFQDNSAHFLVQSAVLGNIKYVGHSNNLRKLSHFGYFAVGFFTEILRPLQTWITVFYKISSSPFFFKWVFKMSLKIP